MLRRFLPFCFFSLLIFAFTSCDQKGGVLFTKISPSSSNINFKNLLVEDESFNVLNYPYFYNGGGVAVGDINNDSLPDIFFTGNMVKNRLYLNKGSFDFEDITIKSTVAEKQGWCTGATMADVNADGWLDVYICRSADGDPARRRNLLYINNHDNTFTEQAETYGIADEGYSTQAAFFDYDRDNDLDLVVINHSSKEYMQGQQEKPGIRQQTNYDFSTHLYRNDKGKYKDVTREAGITSNVLTFGLGLAVSDLNNDGWPDLYISNDFNEADYCFINRGDGTFVENSREMFAYTSLFSMGNEAADINNDGLQDLITLDMLPEDNYLQKMHNGSENFDKFQILFNNGFLRQYSRNMLQLNRGDGTFDEVGQFAGISNTDWSWAPLAADFDNDGRKDVFISNGYVKDYTDMDYIKYNVDIVIERDPVKQEQMMRSRMDKLPTIRIPNYIFRNEGDLRFANVTKSWGLDEPSVAAGAAYADFDGDGDLDLVVNNCNDPASLYRNDLERTDTSGHFIKVKLKGAGLNPFGVGARISVASASGVQVQELMPSRGFQSSVDYVLHFGLPGNETVRQVEVRWPDGYKSVVNTPGIDKTITVDIKEAVADTASSPGPQKSLFVFADSLPFYHQENNFNDFSQQPLLPQWFSRRGPAMAKGDLNGDGREDIFVGAAKGRQAGLFLGNAAGAFTRISDNSIRADSAYEDQVAAIFDADGDGDNDLFVGSGGYELDAADPLLQNRLYLNDGKGRFTRSVNGLPNDVINDYSVTVLDANGDGLPDLFNGGFCVPGKYPEASGSQLLVNDGKGKFTDQTAQLMPGFNRNNLVTSSVSTHLNNDRLPEIIIAGHWMPVEVWVSQKSALRKDTAMIAGNEAGLYNTLTVADIDNDGYNDVVAGNQGLNTQFAVSRDEPMEMFYDDFDGNGTSEPVISYYIQGKRWPIYSRDDLVQQIPSYNKRFLYYSDYAKSTLEDILGDKLKTARHYSASRMSSVVLRNEKGRLTTEQLPSEAQWYPVNTIVASDVNGDNQKDIILGGNESNARIKFGAYGAGRGDVFINNGGTFKRISSAQSGIAVQGDVRNIVIANGDLIFGINNQRPLCFTLAKN